MNEIEKIKKLGLIVLGILYFQIAFSQKNYVSGYVIKNNTDTIYGLVDYRNWDKNPDKIDFKTDIDSNPISFNPADITEFKVENEIYVSGIVNTEITSLQTEMLREDPQIILKVETTFLQTLFRGKKSLYYFKNYDGRENFYIKQDTGYSLLLYKRYLKRQDGNLLVTENKTYVGQLTIYLNDCLTIKSKLENTSYKQNSLLKLFQYYYECSSSDIFFQKEKEKTDLEIGVLAGVSLTSLEFGSDAYLHLVNAGYKPSTNFSCGMYFDFHLSRNFGRWSINNELLFSTYQVKGTYESFKNINKYSLTTTEFGYSYFKVNTLARFKYPIGHIFLYLNGGLSNGYAINETNYKKIESKFYETESLVEEKALKDTRKYEIAFILGSGIKYKNYSIEFRAEKGNGMSLYTELNSTTTRYYFLFGYRFK